MQTPEQLKATAQTLIELAEKLEKEKEAARPWRPSVGKTYYYAGHTIAQWYVVSTLYDDEHPSDAARMAVGNCYRTESEAQDVADQRNFIERCLKAGDLKNEDKGWTFRVTSDGFLFAHHVAYRSLCRKFSTEAKARAFVNSEGGEAEFVKKFSRGWV